jgi:hypothetical protein
MANPEHCEHCKQGVDVWNDWRKCDHEMSYFLFCFLSYSLLEMDYSIKIK